MNKVLFPSQGKGHDNDENEKENNETLLENSKVAWL